MGDVHANDHAPELGRRKPMPLRDLPEIVVGHGGGGAMSGELIEQLFLPAYADAAAAALGDSAVLGIVDARIAFSTDSFVVRPMFFPEAPSVASPSTAR